MAGLKPPEQEGPPGQNPDAQTMISNLLKDHETEQEGPRNASGGECQGPAFGGTGTEFSIADMLQFLPNATREELLNIDNQDNLEFHLARLKELIDFDPTYNNTTIDSDLPLLGFCNAVTHPTGAAVISYYLSPELDSPNTQTYALLMLKFTNNTSENKELLRGDIIDYSVKINGTNNFNFETNGTTDTGVDIKSIYDVRLINALNSTGNYFMAIDILNINNNTINEKTGPLTVNVIQPLRVNVIQ